MSHSAELPPATPSPHRRNALKWLTAGLGAVASAVVAVPLVGYLFGSFFKREDERADRWIDVGPADSFPPHQTRLVTYTNPHRHPWDGMTGHAAAYVRRLDEKQYLVLAVNCAHLGCPVTWFPQSGLFLCPCHGGVYYEDGAHASGPPPRGLYRYEWQVVNDRLLILAGHLPTLHDPLDPKDTGLPTERRS